MSKKRIIEIIKKISPKLFLLLTQVKQRYLSNISTLPERVCHYKQLFIRSDGDIYPCCWVWSLDNMKIGHINDIDLDKKIEKFSRYCVQCGLYRLRKSFPQERIHFDLIHIELSLVCQGNCAMCFAEAPAWQGNYDYYSSLTKLIEYYKPKYIKVQGGEILIQKKSMQWLSEIKKSYPDIKYILVTNGNVPLEVISPVKDLFNHVIISIVGFQSETIKKIMELEFKKTIDFAENLIEKTDLYVCLKYLITPINIHEISLFFNWALKLKPDEIQITDANTGQYINYDTPDNYWDKIIKRTSKELRGNFIQHRDELLAGNIFINIDRSSKKMLDITDEFIEENTLGNVIRKGYYKL